MNYDAFFKDLKNDAPYLKIGIEGFAGSGKTFLAASLAIGLHKRIGSQKPIVVYDTERAFATIWDMFKDAGIEVKIRESRSLKDWAQTIEICKSGYSDILITDSVSHIWSQFTTDYIEAKKKRLKNANVRLSFPDWGYLKPKWKESFSDNIVNSHMHIIFTGRATYEYDHEEDEETGKMSELRKTGIKMSAERETAYEPNLLVLMETKENVIGAGKKEVYREATILKDRYRVIDGKTFKNPTFKDFEPVIEKMLSGTRREDEIQENKDDFSELEKSNENWQKKRDVILEEIEAIFTSLGLGTSKEDRKIKVDLFEVAFETTSWTAIQNKRVTELESALEKLKQFKTLMLQYMKDCAETSSKPDPSIAYEYIFQVWDKRI